MGISNYPTCASLTLEALRTFMDKVSVYSTATWYFGMIKSTPVSASMASSAQCICLLFILSLQVVAFPVINERAIHQLNKVSDSDGRDRNLDGRSTLAIFAGNLAYVFLDS